MATLGWMRHTFRKRAAVLYPEDKGGGEVAAVL